MTYQELKQRARAAADPAADLALVRGFRAREPEAMEAFTERMRCIPLTLRALNRRTGRSLDEHELLDVVQDCAVLVLRKLDSFDGRGPLEAWVYGLCQFELYNAVRRRRRRPVSMESDPTELLEPTSPSGVLLSDHLEAGLETLEQAEREIVRLKHFEGLTFERIAELLELSANTAKTRYYRGLKKLQEFMEPRRQEFAS